MLETFDTDRIRDAAPDEIGDALEQGRIVFFPDCPIELPRAQDLATLRDKLPQQLVRKNVSYHPEADRIKGLDDKSDLADLSYEVLTQHRDRVTAFLERVMPSLATNIRVGTCSFRPIEERGRNLTPHASNELVHVDAGAYGATNGDRILRFFVNVNPSVDRIWATKGRFPELFDRYGREAHLIPPTYGRLDKKFVDKLRTSALNGIGHLGLPLAKMLDSSPYDRVMRKFHNYMKDTPEFQRDKDGYQEFRFPPYSAWMVFTDMVSHACLSGQHALVYTAIASLQSCKAPELAPFNILRNAA